MKRLAIIAALVLAACGQPPATAPDADAVPAAAPESGARSAAEIATIVAALPAPYNAGDYEKGRQLWANCRSCHTTTAGGPNGVGPNLHGVFGKAAGTHEGFKRYSEALKASGIVWDEAKVDAWIANPRDVVPENGMIFPGLRNEADRRNLIAYLRVETGE
jgi:cytochrome c